MADMHFYNSADFNNNEIKQIATPSTGTSAANKDYVDNLVRGIDQKQDVRVASTANVTVAGPGAAIDGVTLSNGDRVLLKNQTAGEENGIYQFNGAASAMTRTLDADSAADILGALVAVQEGTVNADTMYRLITNAPITLGTTSLSFASFGGGATLTEGDGIDITGSVVSVVAADASLTVGPSGVSVATGVRRTAPYVANVGDGSSTSIALTHSLGSRDVTVEVYRNSSPYDTITCSVERTSTTQVTLVFGSAPTSNQFRAIVTLP